MATIEQLKGLKADYYDQYTQHILTKFNMPEEVKEKVSLFFEGAKFSDIGIWGMYRSIFSADALGNTNLLCIMTQRTSEDKFNTFVFSMANSIKFEPNVLLVTRSKRSWFGLFSKTDQELVKIPVTMTTEDMELISDYFDQVIYDRFMRYFDARNFPMSSLTHYGAGEDKPKFGGFLDVLGAVEKTYDLVKKIFGSSTKTEIVQSYTKLGFEHYDNVVTIQYYLGVAESNIDRLKGIIVRSLSIPADKVDAFNDYIDFADCMDASSWTNFQSFLRSDNEGGSKTAQIFFNKDEATNKYNVFVTDTKADFKVADDVYVMKRSKSRMGGMFEKEEIIYKRQSHTITAEDAEVLMTFFDVIALKKFKLLLDTFKPVSGLKMIA
jgi:hypothetical protein